jgi:hypothetical protein
MLQNEGCSLCVHALRTVPQAGKPRVMKTIHRQLHRPRHRRATARATAAPPLASAPWRPALVLGISQL